MGLLARLIILIKPIVSEKQSKTSRYFLLPNLAVNTYFKKETLNAIQAVIELTAKTFSSSKNLSF